MIVMTGFVDRAKAYVAASNAHDLAAISPMLAPGCVYYSAAVGRYVGTDAILAMMQEFFGEYPDAHWQVDAYSLHGVDVVEFDFEITLLGKASSGHERLYFNRKGLICRVEVER